jgi:hypothetical protein
MKKIEPVIEYESDSGYPSLPGDGLDRRRFLRTALASTAALGGTLLLGTEAGARKRSAYHRATLHLRGYYRYYPCRYRAESLLVQTRSKGLAKLLADVKEQARAEQALAGILRAASCTDVQNQKNLARLHGKLAQALATHYRKRTGRKVGRPIVTLTLRRIRHVPVPGGIRRPPRPHP